MRRLDGHLRGGDATRRAVVTPTDGGAEIGFDGAAPRAFSVATDAAGRLVLRADDGTLVRGAAVRDGAKIWVAVGGRSYCFEAVSGATTKRGAQGGLGEVRAPMTGKVVEVAAKDGDVVEAGAHLLTLEAMKMEHRLTAPVRARVTGLRATVGAKVSDGETLLVLTAPEAAP
jgi:acetyl/propionyl-CoA carboxylase alpha subunit